MEASKRADLSRDKILNASRVLFGTHGFHQTAMSELAACAGVSVGQVYRFFVSKSEIILAIVREDADARLRSVEAILDEFVNSRICVTGAFERLLEESMEADCGALSFEILAEAHRTPPVAELITSLCARYRASLRCLASAVNPDLSEEDLEGASELLLACLFGLSHRHFVQPSLSSKEAASRGARMIVASLMAANGSTRTDAAAWVRPVSH
jgi:TetR/AcrR family transcriptional repressor of uid operon